MALCDVASRLTSGESLSVGRDGASDAGSFLEAGVPAVEFGPSGAGHHGPDEWVSIAVAGALPAGARRLHPPPARGPRAPALSRAARRRRGPGVNPQEPVPHVGRGLLKRARWPASVIVLLAAGSVSRRRLPAGRRRSSTTIEKEGRAPIDIPEIDRAQAGEAQTLMILGSDQRYGDKKLGLKPRSDTIILVRARPGQGGDRGDVGAARPQGRRSPATARTRSTPPTSSAARA